MPGEITLTSTTETQAALDHAMSDDWQKPFDPEAAQEAAAEADGKEADPEEETPNPPQPRGNWQKRVDKLTRRSSELQETVERLQAELNGLKSRPADVPAAKQGPAGKPLPDDPRFSTYEDYVEALTDWKMDQKIAADAKAKAEATEKEHATNALSEYNKQLEATRAAHADFEDVVESIASGNVQIPDGLQPAIIESGNGPEIVYYLGKHPEVARQLCEMSLPAAAVEIGRISVKLPASRGGASTAKPKSAATTAPTPINPVGARGSAQPTPLDKAPYREFLRRTAAGEK